MITSKLTKVVQTKLKKSSFFNSNILLKNKTSITIIKMINLPSKRDLKIGLLSRDKWLNLSFNIPGFRNCTVVDKKKYKKKATNSQQGLLNLNLSSFFFITNNEITTKISVCKLTAKFPKINHRGKV